MSIVKYDGLNIYLHTLCVPQLKKKAKLLKLKKYSKLKKADLILFIIKYFAVIKIQRFLRNKFSTLDICLFSREPVRYPCWCKIATKTGHFFYYNLEPLVRYIIAVGNNAKDPGLLSKYTMEDIKSIDTVYKSIPELQHRVGVPSIVNMLLKTRHYRRQIEWNEQVDIYLDLLNTASNSIKDRVKFYHDECYDVDINIAMENINSKIGYMKNNMDGLYRISKYWSEKSFKMILQNIDNLDFESTIKQRTLALIKKEKSKFTYTAN